MPRPHRIGVGCCSEIADGPDRKCASREKLLHWLSARHDLPFEGTRSHRSGAEAEARRSFAQHTARCNSDGGSRSEEHTSELQSLMRNSYAVFCLKKKNKT